MSLWINQSIKGIRGRNGQVVENAHVLGLFNRICKLLFYKIKPVFVFDGKCPQLKRNTISKRVEQRLKAVDRSREASIKILENYVSTQLSASQQKLPPNASLPPLQSSLLQESNNKSFKVYEELAELQRNHGISDDIEDNDSDSEPSIAQNYRNIQNFDSMDLNSEDFNCLPPEIKYEILTEMKQKFKGYRNRSVLPQESNDFSSYQLERLLKKRTLQSKIEDTIKQLNGENSEELMKDWNEKGFHNDNEFSAGRLASDENTRFVFLKKSQVNGSQNCGNTSNSTKEMSDPSLPSIERYSVDNQSIIVSDSEDFEEEIPKQMNSSIICENDTNFIENNEQKTPNSSNKSLFEKTIEISDESDIEEEPEININPNKIIEIKVNEQAQNCSQNNEKVDSKIESTKNMHLTTIEANQVNSESSDEEFIEVMSETSHTSDKLNSDQKLENIAIDSEKTNDFTEDSINLEEFLEANDGIKESIPEVIPPIGLTSNSEPNNVYEEPKASTSQSIEFKEISREELLETCREANKQNRFANHTTDQMMTDCQELLKLFGIPFVISPTEAEAQCAALEEMSLTNGTITDDSDILLFGAKTVYKNFFTSSKYVEEFNSIDIQTRFGLTRSSLICIAMLCGSDYTDGVDGVGAVKATEILSEFRGEGLQPLIDLKNWWQNKQNSKDKRPENKIRANLMKLKLSESFPNRVIFDAYMKPTVDNSAEKFVWGMPQLDELRRYAALKFGWTVEKCDQILLPVMKKVNEKQVIIF